MQDCLPIHPQPLQGESLTSWINRLASSNVYTVQQLLSCYLGEADWRHRDLDFLDKGELTVLSRLGCVQGGAARLWTMVLGPWKDVVTPLDNVMDQKSWICSHYAIRYCPICFSENNTPYLRLLWRLHFLPICTHHGVVLQRGFANTRATQSQPKVPKNASPIKPTNCTRVSQFSASITHILESRKLPEEFGWTYTLEEFFLVLLTLVRYFNLYLPREPSWKELLIAHGISSAPPFEWRDNDGIACLLIENALVLIEKWPRNISNFIAENHARFRRLRVEYGPHCPIVLSDLITNLCRTNNLDSSSERLNFEIATKPPKEMPGGERIRNAVDYLLKINTPLSLRAVCRVARVSFQTLKNDTQMCAVISDGNARFRCEQESEVRNAVKELRERGLKVSVASVATYLGRSYRYLKKSPNLLSIVRSGTSGEGPVSINS